MHVYILHIELNWNAAQDMFCTVLQAGPGKLSFTKDTGISVDRQRPTDGETAWLAPLGSLTAVCEKTLTSEETLESALSRIPHVLQLMHTKVQATHVSHITLPT